MDIIGVEGMEECPICEQHTLDRDGFCHNGYCSDTFIEDYLNSLAEPDGYYP